MKIDPVAFYWMYHYFSCAAFHFLHPRGVFINVPLCIVTGIQFVTVTFPAVLAEQKHAHIYFAALLS